MDANSGRLVELRWGRMFVRRGGSGPPLILIHGWLVSGHYFEAVCPELEKRFDVIAIDLPGHGESDSPPPDAFDYSLAGLADAVAAAMDAIGIARAHVWGHSMGGGVALHLAARHPQRVERLLLEDCLALRMPVPFLARVADLPGIGRFLFLNIYSRRDISQHLHSVHNNPAVCTDADVDFYWERLNRPGARLALHAMLRQIVNLPPTTGALAQVKAPTLVVFGAGEKTVPIENGRKIAAGIAGARFDVIPDCGHSPHEERPAEVLALALPFLTSEEATTVGERATS